MVAQVLKHQWVTTLVPLRKGAKPAEIFGLIFLVLVSLFLGGNYFAYVWAAGQLAIDPRGASTAVAGASLIVFWITVPVLFGAQPTYTDPSRYAVFSRRARELMPAFVVVGLLSWGGVVTLVASVSHVLAWSSAGAVAMVTAVLGVLLGWSAAMIASNLLLVAMSAVMAKRRFRETMMILVMLLCCGLGLGMQVVTRTATVTRTVPVNVGRIIGWTPLGWAWSMPWEVAHGRWLAFAIKLVVSIATVAVMVWAWQAIVARRLVAPTGDGGSVEKVKAANGIDRMMPATPTGAITGRTLRYLKRDPRMTSLLLNTFLVPLLASAPMLVHGGGEVHGPQTALIFTAIPFAAMLVATPMYAGSLISYDGTALWHHIESSVTGVEDRRGRAIAYLLVTMPVSLALAVIASWWCGQWKLLPVVSAEALGVLLLSTGIGSWTSVVNPMRVVESRKGNGFNSGSSVGAGCLGALLGMGAGILVVIPMIALVVLVAISGHAWWSILLTFVGGLGWSFLVLHFGIVVGGRRLDRTWDEVLTKITPVA